MNGSILQISSSPGGLPKRAMLFGFLDTMGLEGDGHAHPTIHGGPGKAILLIAAEIVDDLAARGYPVFYGAMGENLTTRGIDIRALRVGDRLRAGGALLEITQPRGPCTALDIYGPSIKDEIYDFAGEVARCGVAALGHERAVRERDRSGGSAGGRSDRVAGAGVSDGKPAQAACDRRHVPQTRRAEHA